MPIYTGSNEITSGNLKLGGADIQEVYYGSQLIWPTLPLNEPPFRVRNELEQRNGGSSFGFRGKNK